MTSGRISSLVVTQRAAWIRRMLANIRTLPTQTHTEFTSDPRTAAAAESYLRRALEALLDLGRHVLSKGFARGVAEYKAIPPALEAEGLLGTSDAEVLVQLAGYRNRMVHFYHAIADEELRVICRDQLGDVERVLDAILSWLAAHPERVDSDL